MNVMKQKLESIQQLFPQQVLDQAGLTPQELYAVHRFLRLSIPAELAQQLGANYKPHVALVRRNLWVATAKLAAIYPIKG